MTSTEPTVSEFARILAELADPMTEDRDHVTNGHNPFHLATLADCYSPDSSDSPGAQFLARIARDVADRLVDSDEAEGSRYVLTELTEGDAAHEIADSAVPIYTHDMWATFADLGAYNEDPTGEGLASPDDGLSKLAGIALYMIAERLVRALAEELTEALDADADSDDEEQDTRPDGSIVYYTRDPADGYYTATTSHGIQVGPGRFETVEDARAYLASLDSMTDES